MSSIEHNHGGGTVSLVDVEGVLETSAAIPAPMPRDHEISSPQNQGLPMKVSSPVLNNADEAAKQNPVGTSVDCAPKERAPIVDDKPALKSTPNDLRGHNGFTPINQGNGRRTKTVRSSKLNPNYSTQLETGKQAKRPMFPDQSRSYVQTSPDNNSTYGALENNFETMCLPWANNNIHLGYQTESNERTKVLPNNSSWQRRANLIEKYPLPLCSSPATPIAHSHPPLASSLLSSNTPSLPIYKHPKSFPDSASSYPTVSHPLELQSDTLHYTGAPVNSNSIYRPAPSATTNSTTITARSNQSFSTRYRPMDPSTVGKVAGSKKRPRPASQSQTVQTVNTDQPLHGTMVFNQTDSDRIQSLIAAMNDMDSSEDNAGMKGSWDKMRVGPSTVTKIEEICQQLFFQTMRAVDMSIKGKRLCDRKRSANTYATFDDRFNAICHTLRTQKTVCKHLMEDPYLYQVVDDPLYACMRVANNRRVNYGKKVAIETGRKVLGLKGNGKGHPLVKHEVQDEQEKKVLEGDLSDDGEYDDEADAEGDEDETAEDIHSALLPALPTPTLRDRSSLKKPTYVSQDAEDVLESTEGQYDEATNEPKRKKRSKAQKTVLTDSTAVSSRQQTEEVEKVKTEPEVHYPVSQFVGNSQISMAPSKPSPSHLTGLGYGFQDNLNVTNAILPYDHIGYHNGFEDYVQDPYQIDPQIYPTTQQPASHYQGTFSPFQAPLNTMPTLNSMAPINTMTYDGSAWDYGASPSTDPFASEPVTDEADIPTDFMGSHWMSKNRSPFQ